MPIFLKENRPAMGAAQNNVGSKREDSVLKSPESLLTDLFDGFRETKQPLAQEAGAVLTEQVAGSDPQHEKK